MEGADLKLLARRVGRGERAAFRGIVEHTQSRLYRLASRLMGNTADAEDVLQEAYVKAFSALQASRFDERSSVQTWLYRIVTNTAIDATRRRKLRPIAASGDEITEGQAQFDTHISTEARIALKELSKWLEDLSAEQRAVVILRTVEGFSTAETAELLGCSAGAVEQRLIRARANLSLRRGQT